jgi:dephospho-CoA kinase
MEKIIVVSASKKNQIERLMERNSLSREGAKDRIRAQMPLEEKRKYADYVINTDVSLKEVRKQVRGVHGKLMAIRAKGSVASPCSHAPTRND